MAVIDCKAGHFKKHAVMTDYCIRNSIHAYMCTVIPQTAELCHKCRLSGFLYHIAMPVTYSCVRLFMYSLCTWQYSALVQPVQIDELSMS